jgi:hypothetical protein
MQLKLSFYESVETITSQARDDFSKFDLLMRSKALEQAGARLAGI